MRKDLQAIKYLNDTCINFLDRTKELYCTVTFTRKRAEILRDNIAEVEQALHRLEAIDNAKPSEALECFENMQNRIASNISTIEYTTIKQALLKAQEPKQYLKWEDLEFEEARCQYSNVKLGNANFQMTCYLYKGCMKKVWIRNEIISFELKDTEEDKQFFNDLHLERVEE